MARGFVLFVQSFKQIMNQISMQRNLLLYLQFYKSCRSFYSDKINIRCCCLPNILYSDYFPKNNYRERASITGSD